MINVHPVLLCIIIEDILNIRKKTLFMLGIYEFNDIINFLSNNDNNKNYCDYITDINNTILQ